MNEDPELLRRYLDERSEAAFTELTERHIRLVYATALRRVGGDTQLAEDVVQKVFMDLARKARSQRNRYSLTGWLFRPDRGQIAPRPLRPHRHPQVTARLIELAGLLLPRFSFLMAFLRTILATCGVAGSSVLLAQIGDNWEKPGFVQVPIVPAEQIPPAPALSPEEALKQFKVAPGFRIEPVAAEPLVQDPVAMQFGPDGRLWVVEMRGYMPNLEGAGEENPTGRISVLTDTDGDGKYDKSTVFLDHLILPRAFLLTRDGALVGAPPNLWFYRDTNGDGVADEKTDVAFDFGVQTDPKRPFLANPERAPNSLVWGLDNWIYVGAYTKRFRFRNGSWESAPTVFRGQWGLSQDDFGHLFHNSNSDSLRVDLINASYLSRNSHYPRLAGTNVQAADNQLVWPDRVTPGINRGYRHDFLRPNGKLREFTAACAPWIYRADLFPDEFYGNAFIAEPSAHLIKRKVLHTVQGEITGRDAYDQVEFITSTDERFRPVNLTTGPDGALYIVDLYRGVLQHRISLTTYLRGQIESRGLVDPVHLGRIYRVVPDGAAPKAAKPQLHREGPAEWVKHLSHPNSWWRETAQQLLVERGDKAVVPALRELARKGSAATGRMHALWTLSGLESADRATLEAALQDPAPVVRVAALRISEPFQRGDDRIELLRDFKRWRSDPSAEVRLQWVLSAGEARESAMDKSMAEVVRWHPEQSLLLDALYSGIAGRELILLETLLADVAWAAREPGANHVLTGLIRGLVAARDPAQIDRALTLMAGVAFFEKARLEAMLDGFVADVAQVSKRPLIVPGEPSGLAALRKLSISKATLAQIDSMVIWPGKEGVKPDVLPKVFTPEEQALFDNGKTLYTGICAACHQADGRGFDGLAPQLVDSEWVQGLPERLVRIILHGARGPIRVAGKTFVGDMPGLGVLSDHDIASILTYVRHEWGHTSSPITVDQVKQIRSDSSDRKDAWSQEELMLIK